jgi:hypothetical protein
MERCSGRPELGPVNSHGVERLSVHDAEAAAIVHQHLGEMLGADEGVNDERISPRVWDILLVVGAAEGDGGLRPSEESGGR